MFRKYIAIITLFFISSLAYSEVFLNIKPYTTASNGDYDSFKDFMRLQLELGGITNHLEILSPSEYEQFIKNLYKNNSDERIITVGGQVRLTATLWPSLPTSVQNRIIEFYSLKMGAITAYEVSIDKISSHLYSDSYFNIIENDSIPSSVEDVLPPIFKKYKNKKIDRYGYMKPNCWYVSMAAHFKKWKNPHFVSEKKFKCLINTYFKKVSKIEFGDIIRFTDKYDRDEHAAIYIGRDVKSLRKLIVLTKNGRRAGKFMYMDLNSLKNKLYNNTNISFYRPIDSKLLAEIEDQDICENKPKFNKQESEHLTGEGKNSDNNKKKNYEKEETLIEKIQTKMGVMK